MIKNVIFDWSGVINDNRKLCLKVINAIFVEFKAKPLTWKDLRINWQQPYMLFYKKYIPKISLATEQRLYNKYYKTIKKEYPSSIFKGMKSLVLELKKQDKKLFIISSDPLWELNKELEKYGLKGVFTEIISGVHNKQTGLNKIIKKYHCLKKETVFIGDSTHEIECGQKAGTLTIGVTWGFDDPIRIKKMKPTFVANTPKQLLNFLNK